MTAFIAALIMAVGVGLGAFGAHGLKNVVDDKMLAVWETAVRYHLIHGLGLVAVGLFEQATGKQLRYVAPAFYAGIMLFSGSLYVLSLSGVRWLGAITPLGGVAFIAGWAALAYATLPK
jgi:uncharacterized membrane protein YgdD (TMEM256/DUF423 family)